MDPTNLYALYAQNFNEVKALYDDEQFDLYTEKAKSLLTDTTLPRFLVIKTCMLIVALTKDWDLAEVGDISTKSAEIRDLSTNIPIFTVLPKRRGVILRHRSPDHHALKQI